MENILLELLNPEFSFSYMGKEYLIKKATLDKTILYHEKIDELSKNRDPAADIKLAAYCLYIILRDVDSSITEEYVLKNTRGDIDTLELLTILGFINPRKMETTKKIQEDVMRKLTSDDSLQP